MVKTKVLKLPTDEFVRAISNKNLLFHDQFNEPYLAVNGSGSKVLKIGKSPSFTGWLNYCSCRDYNVILKNNQVKDITCGLAGLALCGESKECQLEPRLRKIGNEIWYDLGKEAVCISDKGWKIVKEPPIIFRRYSHQKQQVKPIRGGNIQEFRKFTNITNDDDWNLFLAFTIATLIPDIPKPVLILNGSQGAGKSTPMRMLKELADPSQLASAGKITGEKDLAFLASHHSLLFFDNLSFLERDNSDLLCRLITGDGFSKRKLYTDDDEVIYNFKRPLMLNGINNFVTQADLLDRALILNVERIPEEKRLTEIELWSKFNEEKPLLLGAMFDILSKAMKIFPDTPVSGLPRMADFGRWGYAIYSAINNKPFEEFGLILSGNKQRQIEESVEADPVASLAKFLANTFVRWKGTARSFLNSCYVVTSPEDIRCLEDHTYWPKDVSQVGKRLRKAEGVLRESKIELTFGIEDNNRIIYLVDKNYPYPESVPFAWTDSHTCETEEDILGRQKLAYTTSKEDITQEMKERERRAKEHQECERQKFERRERSRRLRKFLNSSAASPIVEKLEQAIDDIEAEEEKEKTAHKEYLSHQPQFEDL